MIKVYGNIHTRAFRVLWLLEELNLEYQHIPINFKEQEHRSDWFLKINPLGKVPAVEIDNLLMFESAAIITTLCERYAKGTLIPDEKVDPDQKANYLQWMFFIMSELDASLWTLAKHKFAYPKELRCAEARPGAIRDFTKSIKVIEEHLAKPNYPYMLGKHFSAVDLLLTTIITWTKILKIQDLVPLNIQRWSKLQIQRPAFKKASLASQA